MAVPFSVQQVAIIPPEYANCFVPPSLPSGSSAESSSSAWNKEGQEATEIELAQQIHLWLPKEIVPGPIDDAPVFLSGQVYLPPNEYLFIIPEGGPIQFIRGDRPQEYIGTEVCLVRNHRFEGFYFLRSNGVVGPSIIDMIGSTLQQTSSIEDRNRYYLESKAYLSERVIGTNCGMFVDFITAPYPIFFSMKGFEVYDKAMRIFSSPNTKELAQLGLYGSEGMSDNTVTQNFLPKNDITNDENKPQEMANGVALRPCDTNPDWRSQNRVVAWTTGSNNSSGYNGQYPGGDEARGMAMVPYGTMGRRYSRDTVSDTSNTNPRSSGEFSRPDGTVVPRHLNKKTNTLYKTEMCRNWDESGECRYGRTCQFAHGSAELRTVKRHGQWKTKTCLAWVNGGCTYGSRCCYAHEIMEKVQEDLSGGAMSLPHAIDANRRPRLNAQPAKNERPATLPPTGVSRFAGFFKERLANSNSTPKP